MARELVCQTRQLVIAQLPPDRQAMLTRLRLFEFRCHARLEIEPGPRRNALIGSNGQGKTSILEALYYLSRLRSFRTGQPREMARTVSRSIGSANGFAIEAEQNIPSPSGTRSEKLAIKWEDGTRQWSLDGDSTIPLETFWSRLSTVLFSAEDAQLIRGPALRRQGWLDALRGIEQAPHLGAVRRYNAILKQRNAWLRQRAMAPHQADPDLGTVLTRQLIEQGAAVTAARTAAAATATRLAAPLLDAFFGGKPVCRFTYRPHLELPPQASGETIPPQIDWDRIAPQEQRLQRTLVGPHRDEWEIVWKEKAAARFGSEGEQRLAALLLRLIEAACHRESRRDSDGNRIGNGAWPLFLIDDALTPLDPERKLTWDRILPAEAQIIQAGTIAPAACDSENDLLWSIGPGSCIRG